MTLTPDDIRTLHGGGALSTADILATLPQAEKGDTKSPVLQTGTADAVVLQLPVASDEDDMEDYSANVAELATNWNFLWCSMKNPAEFVKNWKVNFLHLDDSGNFTLTVIKPGTKKTFAAKIDTQEVAQARKNLQNMQWVSVKEGWGDEQAGDVNGNTYKLHRYVELWEKIKLVWHGSHKNVFPKVEVDDVLSVTRDFRK